MLFKPARWRRGEATRTVATRTEAMQNREQWAREVALDYGFNYRASGTRLQRRRLTLVRSPSTLGGGGSESGEEQDDSTEEGPQANVPRLAFHRPASMPNRPQAQSTMPAGGASQLAVLGVTKRCTSKGFIRCTRYPAEGPCSRHTACSALWLEPSKCSFIARLFLSNEAETHNTDAR